MKFTERIGVTIALVALVSLGAFLPSLGGGFVYDDHALIVDNARLDAILDGGPGAGAAWADLLASDFGSIGAERDDDTAASGYFRPVIALSYVVDGFVWSRDQGPTAPRGFNPFGFRLTNVLFHAIASVLVLLVGRRLAGGTVGLIAGLFFAVHPVHVESVAWIAGRTDVIAGCFALFSVYALLRARSGARRGRWVLAAIAAYTVAAFSKEAALWLPFVPAALCLRDRSRPALVATIAFIGVTGVYLLLRHLALDGPAPNAFVEKSGDAIGVSTIAASFVRAIGWYGAKLVWPWSLALFADVPFQTPGAVIIDVVIHIALLAVGYGMLRSKTAFAPGLALLAVYASLVPLSCVLPGARLLRSVEHDAFPVAARFCYLPSAAAVLLVAMLIVVLARRMDIAGKVAVAFGLAATLSVGWATTKRHTTAFDTDFAYFTSVERHGEWDRRVQLGLAQAAMDGWYLDEALARFRLTKAMYEAGDPRRIDITSEAGLAACHRERDDEPRRIESLKRIVMARPRSARAAFDLGLAYWVNAVIHKDRARLEFAKTMLTRAQRIAPNDRDVDRAIQHVAATHDAWERYYVKKDVSEATLAALIRTFTVPLAGLLNDPTGPRYVEALKVLHRALVAIPAGQKGSTSPSIQAERAALEAKFTSVLERATAYYERMIARHDWSATLHHQFGQVLGIARLRNPSPELTARALKMLAESLDLSRGYLRALVDYAALAKATGAHDDAIARTESAVWSLLRDGYVEYFLGDREYSSHDTFEWFTVTCILWAGPYLPHAMRPYEALDAIRLTANDRGLPRAWSEMAAEQVREIVTACRERAEKAPTAGRWDDLGWILVYAGRALKEPERFAEAGTAFVRALELDPKHARARENLRGLRAELAKRTAGPPAPK